MNNVLIVYLEDGQKIVSSFGANKTEKEALESFSSSCSEKIKSFHFVEEADAGCEVYNQYFDKDDSEELVFDSLRYIIDEKIEAVRSSRNKMLKDLDVPFMRAIEDECEECKQHISKLKNFLRDMPNNLRFEELKTIEEYSLYNPFNNIFGVALAESGEGYETPPEVTIDPPNNEYFSGHQAKAVAFVKDKKVTRIEIVDPGAGYHRTPKITIEAPSEGGTRAVAVCFPPENAVQDVESMSLSEEEINEWKDQVRPESWLKPKN